MVFVPLFSSEGLWWMWALFQLVIPRLSLASMPTCTPACVLARMNIVSMARTLHPQSVAKYRHLTQINECSICLVDSVEPNESSSGA